MSSDSNIILVGLSGTGKTLVGREVARLLGWEFVDTDSEIESKAGKPIRAIFEEEGELAFREMEKRAVRDACRADGRVVSTGGGAIVDPDSRELMLSRGIVVWLEAVPETIYGRLTSDSRDSVDARPMLSGPDPLGRIRELKGRRRAYYSEAHHTVHTDGLTVEQVALEVVGVLSPPSDAMSSAAAQRSPEG